MGSKYLLLGLLFLIAVAPFGPASTAAEEPTHVPSSSTPVDNEESTSTTTTTVVTVSTAIPPLDSWQIVQPSAIQAVTTSTTSGTTLLPGAVAIIPLPERTLEEEVLPDQFEAVLKKPDRKRLERLEKAVRARARRANRAVKNGFLRDPRGDREMRFCSINTNNFGEKKEVRRLAKAAAVAGYAAKRAGLVKAIADTECDLIAIQGIVGRNFAYARVGLTEIEERLEKRTKRSFTPFIAQSSKELGFNGFLAAEDKIEVINQSTHSNIPLVRLPGEEDQQLGRSFLELHFRVKKAGADEKSSSRRFIALSAHLQRGLSGQKTEPESLRWQMGEVLRATAISRAAAELARDRFDPPTLIAGVETVSNPEAGSRFVVEGRRRVSDLYLQKCVIEGEPVEQELKPKQDSKKEQKLKPEKAPTRKMVCNDAPVHEQVLFSVFNDPPPPPRYHKVKAKGDDSKKKSESEGVPPEPIWKKIPLSKAEIDRERSERESTQQIYFTADSLPLSAENARFTFRHLAGIVPVKNGLPASPLVWTDINW